ncbi:MAG: division/cell wall cluster transcriptional repressor MraZ [Nitriliruptorales bacterium]|nr:division/cell wall cluster transcriptional repressor MraZ [Nitriliruptorales bacterium]
MVDAGAAMFLGEFQHTLDPKGRVILPSAFRELLREGLVMTVGLDNCLTVHPVADWQRVVSGLRDLRSTDRRERAFARMITSSAHPDEPDRQGRITIPARLRDYARLTKDVTVVGADSRVELWNSDAWAQYRDQAITDFANTDEPFNLGIF